jgi:VWFA-related protein
MKLCESFLCTTAVLAAVVSSGLAQEPTFRSEINYVELPVRATDARGLFVRDLKAPDFQVFEDGKLQTIAQFSLVDLPLPTRSKPTAVVGVASGAPFTATDLQRIEGRIYLIVLDDYHMRPQYTFRARTLVQDFIRDRMDAHDVGAVLFTSGIRGQDLTQDRTVLLSALDRFSGRLASDEPGPTQEMKARSVVSMLADVSGRMAAIQGRHKALIFVSPAVGCGVSRQVQADFDVALLTGGNGPGTENLSSEGGTAGGQILCQDAILPAVGTITRAEVSVYSIDPRGLQNPGWVSPAIDGRGGPGQALRKMHAVEQFDLNPLDGMHVLADDTGGFAVTGTNSFRKAFDRIVQENTSYYVIGYYSTNDKSDGSVRKNEIQVSRPGVHVWHRPAYVAPRH